MVKINQNEILHFETIDYAGRKIICSKDRWEHICRIPHEYMEGEEQEVINALKKPNYGVRYIDVDYPERRRVYYMSLVNKNCFIKVIVEFEDDDCDENGIIKTAYEPVNMKAGELLEFPK